MCANVFRTGFGGLGFFASSMRANSAATAALSLAALASIFPPSPGILMRTFPISAPLQLRDFNRAGSAAGTARCPNNQCCEIGMIAVSTGDYVNAVVFPDQTLADGVEVSR